MTAYTNEEYYDMLMALGEYQEQHYIAARHYAELYPHRERHPSAIVILGAAQRLFETGSVIQRKNDCGRYLLRAVEEEPETNIRIIGREHGLSYSTIQRIKKEKLHVYHYNRVQHLREKDYPRRKTILFLRG
ncbi:hypothetical protein P5V15_002845 [Pogonomyrmex californicus]